MTIGSVAAWAVNTLARMVPLCVCVFHPIFDDGMYPHLSTSPANQIVIMRSLIGLAALT